MEALARAADQCGNQGEALTLTRRQVERDPFNERAHRRLIERLAVAGDRAGAIRTYRALTERLRRELGVAPSRATRELIELGAHRFGMAATLLSESFVPASAPISRPVTRLALAEALARGGHPDAAAEQLRATVLEPPDFPMAQILDIRRTEHRVAISCLVSDLRFEWRLEATGEGTLIAVDVEIPESEAHRLDTQREVISTSVKNRKPTGAGWQQASTLEATLSRRSSEPMLLAPSTNMPHCRRSERASVSRSREKASSSLRTMSGKREAWRGPECRGIRGAGGFCMRGSCDRAHAESWWSNRSTLERWRAAVAG